MGGCPDLVNIELYPEIKDNKNDINKQRNGMGNNDSFIGIWDRIGVDNHQSPACQEYRRTNR
jgi:hypothetical protein